MNEPQFSEVGSICCAICGKKMLFGTHKSLNSVAQPELVDDVISGKLFEVVCPECGHITNADYEILYHNPKLKLMIYRGMTDDQVNEMVDQYEKIRKGEMPELAGSSTGYIMRFVSSMNELREKVFAGELGIDDRALELTKLLVFRELLRVSPQSEIASIRLMKNGNTEDECDGVNTGSSLYVKYADGAVQTVAFPATLYNEIAANIIDKYNEQPYFVDFRWATEFLTMMRTVE